MIRTATWRRRAMLVAFMVGAGCGAASVSHAGDGSERLTLADVANAFDDAALRVNTAPATELARWTGPIYLAIADDAGMSGIVFDVEASVRTLAAIAHVRVTRVGWRDSRANFIVRANAGDVPGRSPCRSSVDWTETGHMVRAEIHLNLAKPDRVTRCINHEVMHGFGFRAHAHAAVSVLSYSHANQAELTGTDRLMLETLYDPRLQPGMTVVAATSIACGIIGAKLAAPAAEIRAACTGREPRSKRELVAFGGRRSSNDAPTPPSLQPGYRDGGM